MINYEITHSKAEIDFTYRILIDKLNNHVYLLSKEGLPATSVMGMVRGMRCLKLDYLEVKVIKDTKLSEKELLLADKVHKTFSIDVVPAMEIGLLGQQQIKKVLVRHEYAKMAKKGIKYKEIKARLSRKYGVSVSWIEKLIYRK